MFTLGEDSHIFHDSEQHFPLNFFTLGFGLRDIRKKTSLNTGTADGICIGWAKVSKQTAYLQHAVPD